MFFSFDVYASVAEIRQFDQVKYYSLKYKKLEVHLKLKTKCVGHEKDR